MQSKIVMLLPRRLNGMEDFGPQATQTIAWAADALCSLMSSYGYRRVGTPLLEETDLLLRKSGGELASKMYTFTDPGGHRVSLRPEFTSSIVRAYLHGMNGGGPLPVRWSYLGPVFRYEPEVTEHRQFTQVGAELIGASGPWADAEVMALAIQGLSSLGITGHRLIVGHLGYVAALLDSMDISDRARLFLLASVGTLSQGDGGVRLVRQRAEELGLIAGQSTPADAESAVTSEAALALLEQYVQASESSIIGVRTPQEIRERFLRKQRSAQDNGRFEAALNLLSKVVQTRGDPKEVLRKARQRSASVQAKAELDRLADTLKLLALYDTAVPVSLDFGLARGIAYYTGVVFEVQHPASGGTSLGGGGRYDDLIQALGGADPTPAMGFAWSLERVLAATTVKPGFSKAPVSQHESHLVRADSATAAPAAVIEAQRLRAQGKVVQLELDGRSLKECLLLAQSQGMAYVLTVDPDGKTRRRRVP
ncbi:MAG: histidine--tRNA ligase family protein [Dehalococcoidia bacterium]|nr:histidine--tRNA ligase family protein [Dehalococcoidia bacterium]